MGGVPKRILICNNEFIGNKAYSVNDFHVFFVLGTCTDCHLFSPHMFLSFETFPG